MQLFDLCQAQRNTGYIHTHNHFTQYSIIISQESHAQGNYFEQENTSNH